MGLQHLEFELKSENTQALAPEWFHVGVTGSGDLEVIFERNDFGGNVKAKVCTPVHGFDAIWEKMLQKFVDDTGVGNILIDINDDNATPIVVYMRLRQALAEANRKEVK
ncbi:malonate decarboxylase acyl carrier protein [uncultured Veillonella sp.]|uniref:malonate decarboxylase acyl carrier protein n=1 Tax=uncultured Veillonella sp. TaxID=159268 RepID=UPI0025D24E6B|nr:malonate decarboxylase acyl carrier protein [uncultured Veillonella sp.]MDY3973201.1 malonate decarboxylase acyl carrier protein [Veillonella caviae]